MCPEIPASDMEPTVEGLRKDLECAKNPCDCQRFIQLG